MRYFFFCLMGLAFMAAADDVYLRTDRDGHRVYSDRPQQGAKKIHVPDTSTRMLTVPYDSRVSERPSRSETHAARYTRVEITAPKPDSTLHGGTFSVQGRVVPALRASDQLYLHIDTTKRSLSGTVPQWKLTNVDRGAHQLWIQILDAEGAEQGRSATITVHVKRPWRRRLIKKPHAKLSLSTNVTSIGKH